MTKKLSTIATLLLCATYLLWPITAIAEKTMYMSFQKLAFYFAEAENKYYLVVYSTDEATKPGKFDTDNVHIMLESKDGQKNTISQKDLIIINLGEMFYEQAKQYTYFKFNLVIDNSGSIDDQALGTVQTVLTQFINNLPVSFEGQVIKFSTDLNKSGFTKDKQQLINFINQPDNRASTALFDAVLASLDDLKFAEDSIPLKFSIILSDGKENASKRYNYTTVTDFKNLVVSTAKEKSIPLFIVGVTDDVDAVLLKELAGFGLYQSIKDFPDLDKAFKMLEGIIKNTYIFKIPAVGKLENLKKLYIVKESQVTPGKYETIQDILME
ncbi:MAG: hypothetical protein BWK78_00225 [Thiotrichaceae bacterium IS1]|nr:MAG: hypothetical protein BWK78_00225 [Thiotrichaceae bacterium IS1]